MKCVLIFSCIFHFVFSQVAFAKTTTPSYILFSNKQTNYRISLAHHASESEQWAAGELQNWLNKISGADFPIETQSQPAAGPRIFIGYDDFVQQMTNDQMPADNDESFHYFSKGANIFIYGGKTRGTMYGVMTFLENEFGCRWYTPTVEVIPKRDSVKFQQYDHRESPGIRVRNDFYFEAFNPVWAARNKMNGQMNYTRQPGGTEAYWSVHTFFRLLPPEEFFTTHPEYYSLINGKRTAEGSQLCLTNPDVLKITIERIKKQMREHPEYLIYDVSQNDQSNPCQCDKCQSIAKREGSESGPILFFVNQVADAVKKEFPDKYIGTLAYQYTRTPPKTIQPKQNVVIRLCPIEACVAHDLKSCPQNSSFMSDLKTWSSIAPHLYIWDYVVDFNYYIMPFPNFSVLQSNIKTFRENKAIGIMEQADYQSRGGEFSELRSYLISRLLWNADCNTEDVINDFMYGYYGRSGIFIRRYFDLAQALVKPETHMHIYIQPDDSLYSENFIQQSLQLFSAAEKVADDEQVLRRVEMALLPVLFLECKRTPALARNSGDFEKFKRIYAREQIVHMSEERDEDAAKTLTEFYDQVENSK